MRVHLSDNRVQTLLDADPDVVTAPASLAFFLNSNTNPSIFFNNNPITGFASSLSGPDISDFEAFEVSGMQTSVLVSVGYFWRF